MVALSRARASFVALVALAVFALAALAAYERGLVGKKSASAAEKKWAPPATSAELQRWYKALADDQRPYQEWIDAAELITRPRDEHHEFDERGIDNVWSLREKGAPPAPALGEPLRQRKPSVRNLIELRVTSMYASQDNFEQRATKSLAKFLARWDAPAALPMLQRLARELPQKFAAEKPAWRRYWATLAFEFADEREKLGDRAALGEVSHWVETLSPAAAGAEGVYSELEARRARPEIVAMSRRWFEAKRGDEFVVSDVIELQGAVSRYTLVLPGFREYVLARLDDQSDHGAIEVQTDGVTWRRSGDAQSGFELPAEVKPPKDGKFAMRLCDQYAIDLARIEGAPKFEPWRSARERDAQIAALRIWLVSQPLRDR